MQFGKALHFTVERVSAICRVGRGQERDLVDGLTDDGYS